MKKLQGHHAEQRVGAYLAQRSYTIISYNYRLFDGEIDLIASKDDHLFFIEVKQRNSALFDMTELITPSKQKKIKKTALHFLSAHSQYDEYICRFDVALVEGNNHTITYIENAFQ